MIEEIDGAETKGMTLAQVVDRLRGDEGTDVIVKVRQPKETEARTLKITREPSSCRPSRALRKQSSGDWDAPARRARRRSAT